MATFTGITVSSELHLTDARKEVVETFTNQFIRTGSHYPMFEPNGHVGWIFRVCGDEWVSFYLQKGSSPGPAEDEFFDGLAELMTDDERLVVQWIGHEGLRFPVQAIQVEVTRKKRRWTSLSG